MSQVVTEKSENILSSKRFIAEREEKRRLFLPIDISWSIYETLPATRAGGCKAFIWSAQTKADAIAAMEAFEAARDGEK